MSLVRRLVSTVGDDHVLTDAALCMGFTTDWTGRYRGHARFVVRPADREQVAEVLRLCRDEGVGVVPQGGNTGLVGGGIAHHGEVLLSLTRLDALGEVDGASRQVTAGAGVTLAALRAHAAGSGLDFAVDIASRDSATVGGMVATNAGGLRVLRWGSMREQVAGVEAVLADGRVVGTLSGLDKDSTGYDLAGLLTGSEGTLAVITAVRLRLIPAFACRATATLAFASTSDAVAAVAALRALPSLTSAEVFYDDGARLVCAHRKVPPPFAVAHPVYLLVECADDTDPTEALGAAVEGLSGVLDSALAVDEPSRRALWTLREGHADAVNSLGTPLKLDVGVPPAAAAEFEREVRSIVTTGTLVLFGHLAEGNFHVNVVGAGTDEDRITEAVLRAAAAHGGTISAEHGIGVAKSPWLHLTRSPAERALYTAIKHAFDPTSLLNPGVLTPRVAPPGKRVAPPGK
ncbi:FAD/FMN-containing dehydrogenase [Actinokineospora alba]|uniref:FAD/FMN-containing dehydrogenase n=1 Tax=Actinokineospora alba TaxID=504798 RepID=A0A1H0NT07_9PSEU|nr:FAD-binding oxidoreductase [Actinokineospora alba]TDP68828.1 FAD/FMN-containing dehydrogenase [Actinokineospora alba]SDH87551.1 FAD/FMN-containing dehydrogenase [Actinokineospora alba]SDO95530.1 FAD/FMN-containing dehydrogenase [Actinokineospora alba]